MKKLPVILGAVAVLGLSSFLFVQTVSAEENLDDYPPMIQRMAEAFGLNPDEVQLELQDLREEKHDDRMATLIEDGELTEEQVAAIEENHDAMRAELEAIKADEDLSFEEQRDAMRDVHIEYREEAQDLGLPCGDFEGMKGDGTGEGFGMKMGGGFRRIAE